MSVKPHFRTASVGSLWILAVCGSLSLLGCKTASDGPDSVASETMIEAKNFDRLVIEGPIDDLIYNRPEAIFDLEDKTFKAAYRPATFRLKEGPALPGKLRLRGNMRFCDSFPHFKIKLDKGQKLYGKRDYKMVTHGHHTLDPKREVGKSQCAGEYIDNPLDKTFKEYQIYALAQKLLAYHMKVFPLMVDYKDPAASLDSDHKFAFLLEDIDDTAGRYSAVNKVFSPILYEVSWLDSDLERFENASKNIALSDYLAERYTAISRASPKLSETEISEKTRQLISAELMEEFKLQSKGRGQQIKTVLEEEQRKFLRNFDKASLIEGFLFNILVSNGDWTVFGVNPVRKSEGIKNFEFVEKDKKTIYTVPYDFDLAKISNANVVSPVEEYSKEINLILENLKANFEGFLLEEFKVEGLSFKTKLDALLESRAVEEIGYSETARESMKNFSSALGAALAAP